MFFGENIEPTRIDGVLNPFKRVRGLFTPTSKNRPQKGNNLIDWQIIPGMKKNKKKSITIRITETQYKRLIDAMILEEVNINKSRFIRDSINYQISRIKRRNR